MGTDPQSARTLTQQPDDAPDGPVAALPQVLLIQDDRADIFSLQEGGEVLIGRAPECQIRLSEPVASRHHARLTATADGVILHDLDSHNGTTLNGAPVEGPRALRGGDVVGLCRATLLLLGAPLERPRPPAPVSEAALRQRLEGELERALCYGRSLALLSIDLSGGAPGPGRLERELRGLDVIACEGGFARCVLPELEEDEALEVGARLLAAARGGAPAARAGLALFPEDGADAEVLIAAADAAARGGEGGDGPRRASPADVEVDIGGRKAVIADPAMVRLFALVDRLAQSDIPVLVRGETGAGKEVVARALHHGSRRQKGPLVSLNCAALPEPLIEAELFGFARGAFSGAAAQKSGLLEAASGGTLFLDEIGELSVTAQAKLLRVLEDGQLTRLGEVQARRVDLRLVVATHRDLRADVDAGRFRKDLYFRLGAATLEIPPLRDRRRELPILARSFLAQARAALGQGPLGLSAAAMERLLRHGWPGNVRELRNLMGYLAATVHGAVVEPYHLPPQLQPGGAAARAPAEAERLRPIDEQVQELERGQMLAALHATDWNQRRAAELIAMPQRTFSTKYRRYGLAEARRR